MATKRIPIVRAAVAAAVVLGAGAFATRALLGLGGAPPRANVSAETHVAPSTHTDAGAPQAHAIAGLTVTNVTGPVERRVRADDPWRPVQMGDTIALNESLRTGSGGAATLELQDHTSIWLWPESEVTAERLDVELSRVGVAGGRLDVNVPAREARSVEVGAIGGATARTNGARFSIIVDGAHVATVATREGEVDVLSGSGRVRVPPGMQTRARPGEAPEVAMPIPSDLLLDVDWPTGVLRSRAAILRGRAPAGVLVSIGGTRVIVAEDGTFTQSVPLVEGDNHVDVTADDAAGHHVVRRSPPLHVDTHPPSVEARGQWE